MGTKSERLKGKPSWTSAMKSLLGSTLTKLPRRMNTKTNKRRLKAFATQSSPSFIRQLEVPQEVCQVQVHPPVQDPDPLSKRSTNMFSFGFNPPPTGSQLIFSSKPEMLVDLFTFDHQYLLVV